MLKVDDFQLVRAVCELRYEEAYLIYDHAGLVFQSLRRKYPTLSVDQSVPNAIQMTSDEATFVLETAQCRVAADRLFTRPESLSALCETFFDVVATLLEINVFSRVGLRTIFVKHAKDIDSSVTELNSLKLSEIAGREIRFGASNQIKELMLKWEGTELGATFQLKAETAKIVRGKLPPEIEPSQSDTKPLTKEAHYLKLDVDYFTLAPVERSQWNASSWIPQATRNVKKESDKILTLL